MGYVTAPGEKVVSVVTDRGILRKLDGRLRVAAVPAGAGSFEERVRAMVASCGWEAEVAPDVSELAPVTMTEVMELRQFDRRRQFLGKGTGADRSGVPDATARGDRSATVDITNIRVIETCSMFGGGRHPDSPG